MTTRTPASGSAFQPVRHPDGTLCLEGTTSLPPDFQPCCAVFAAHTATCAHDLRYEWRPKSRQWVIAIAESAGGGGIMITYCPHCGALLADDQPVPYQAGKED